MGLSSSYKSKILSLLSDYVEEITTLDLALAVQHLVLLLPKISTHLSYLGQRYITHPSYSGSADLNELAKFYLRLGWRCGREDADLETRLAHYDLHVSFEKLYATSSKQLKEASGATFCNGFREMSLVCAHCIGLPRAVIPERHRAGQPLMFNEELFSELFGERQSMSSTSWRDNETNKMMGLRGAKREWVEEALQKEKAKEGKGEDGTKKEGVGESLS